MIKIDYNSYRSVKGFNSRIRFLVMHYTAVNFSASINALTGPSVSAHYLVPDPSDPSFIKAGFKELRVFNLIDENSRAWHAGESAWGNRTNLNDNSIGIEIVNEAKDVNGVFTFPPFNDSQIKAVTELALNILQRYPDISPVNVVAHSDIAPGRKSDPGAAFPWFELYQAGVGAWYDEATKNNYVARYEQAIPSQDDMVTLFKKYGYDTSKAATTSGFKGLVRAFQLHFRQSNYDGVLDVETAAILAALVEKYIDKKTTVKESIAVKESTSPVKKEVPQIARVFGGWSQQLSRQPLSSFSTMMYGMVTHLAGMTTGTEAAPGWSPETSVRPECAGYGGKILWTYGGGGCSPTAQPASEQNVNRIVDATVKNNWDGVDFDDECQMNTQYVISAMKELKKHGKEVSYGFIAGWSYNHPHTERGEKLTKSVRDMVDAGCCDRFIHYCYGNEMWPQADIISNVKPAIEKSLAYGMSGEKIILALTATGLTSWSLNYFLDQIIELGLGGLFVWNYHDLSESQLKIITDKLKPVAA